MNSGSFIAGMIVGGAMAVFVIAAILYVAIYYTKHPEDIEDNENNNNSKH